MATVLRLEGFVFQIYSQDHKPPHVHVWKAGTSVRIRLGDAQETPSLWSVHGMDFRSARRAVAIAEAHQDLLLEAWRERHGE